MSDITQKEQIIAELKELRHEFAQLFEKIGEIPGGREGKINYLGWFSLITTVNKAQSSLSRMIVQTEDADDKFIGKYSNGENSVFEQNKREYRKALENFDIEYERIAVAAKQII